MFFAFVVFATKSSCAIINKSQGYTWNCRLRHDFACQNVTDQSIMLLVPKEETAIGTDLGNALHNRQNRSW